jgi:hypothetical protein
MIARLSHRSTRVEHVVSLIFLDLSDAIGDLLHGPLTDVGTNQGDGGAAPPVAVQCQRLIHFRELDATEAVDFPDIGSHARLGRAESGLELLQVRSTLGDRLLVWHQVSRIAEQNVAALSTLRLY